MTSNCVPSETRRHKSYFHKSGNIYCCDKNDEVNERLVRLIGKAVGNRNLARAMNILEQRHEQTGTEASWFISPNPTLDCINAGKDRWDKNYQPSLMEEVLFFDKETFTRQFAKIGLRFPSKSTYIAAELKFGEVSEQNPYGNFMYVCYQNRLTHNSIFIRNDPLVNRFANDLRRDAGLPFVPEPLDAVIG